MSHMPAKGAEDSFRSTTVLAVYALPARLTGILCSSVIASYLNQAYVEALLDL